MAQVIYRTHADEVGIFKPITGSFCNKPRGGLWGCRGTEWWDWCQSEEYLCSDKYYEWCLREGTNVYTIEGVNDFCYLLKKYPHTMGMDIQDITDPVDSIDFMKIWQDGYDAVELTEEANFQLRFGLREFLDIPKNMLMAELIQSTKFSTAMLMGVHGWDVPSICVFDPEKTVIVTSGLKLTEGCYVHN